MSVSFDQKRVEFVFERPPLSPPYDVTHNQVFVSYDPSYGTGEAAIVSFFFSDGRLVIAGMETHVSSDPGEERQVLYSHIDQLEACFPKCQIVLIIEGSYGESAKIWTHVLQKKYPNAAVYHEYRERLFGIFTKTTSLGGLWEVLVNKLANDAIFLHDTIVCAGANNGRQEIVGELKKQMLAVRKVALVPPSAPRLLDAPVVLGRDYKDDLVMALLSGVYNAQMSQLANFSAKINTTPAAPAVPEE